MNDKTNPPNKPVFPDLTDMDAQAEIDAELARAKNEPVIDMIKADDEFLPLPAFWS
jgi:hypothetical protein